MLEYTELEKEFQQKIVSDRENNTLPQFCFDEKLAVRRNMGIDVPTVLRPPFIRDIDKIMHSPYYNRYADKTQVFSFYKNDDITRRALHVQLVSRIARTIGRALNLNLDLIEAIALGHDIGHTPFGHTGEKFLSEILYSHTNKYFAHNIHSVRVLDKIFPYNITLQTLNGIAAHDGEFELEEYVPCELKSFEEFDEIIESCYTNPENTKHLLPCTLEGCVVRISDIIAYLGKDRQDAERTKVVLNDEFESTAIGTYNAQIINNMMVNIVKNSYNKLYIKMDHEHFEALKKLKADNYERIYNEHGMSEQVKDVLFPMMSEMFEKFLEDLTCENRSSLIYRHHINYVNRAHYKRECAYECEDKSLIVADYIASMTDDYFIELYAHLFPQSEKKIVYKGYFD